MSRLHSLSLLMCAREIGPVKPCPGELCRVYRHVPKNRTPQIRAAKIARFDVSVRDVYAAQIGVSEIREKETARKIRVF